MSWALCDVVSIATTMRTSRLPSPTAATGHVEKRITASKIDKLRLTASEPRRTSGEGGRAPLPYLPDGSSLEDGVYWVRCAGRWPARLRQLRLVTACVLYLSLLI